MRGDNNCDQPNLSHVPYKKHIPTPIPEKRFIESIKIFLVFFFFWFVSFSGNKSTKKIKIK